jgi:hypothetical protein
MDGQASFLWVLGFLSSLAGVGSYLTSQLKGFAIPEVFLTWH